MIMSDELLLMVTQTRMAVNGVIEQEMIESEDSESDVELEYEELFSTLTSVGNCYNNGLTMRGPVLSRSTAWWDNLVRNNEVRSEMRMDLMHFNMLCSILKPLLEADRSSAPSGNFN